MYMDFFIDIMQHCLCTQPVFTSGYCFCPIDLYFIIRCLNPIFFFKINALFTVTLKKAYQDFRHKDVLTQKP